MRAFHNVGCRNFGRIGQARYVQAMSWARPGALRATPLLLTLAAMPATRAGAAESRPALDLDHIAARDGGFVAPLAAGGEAKLTLDPDLQRAATKILASANPVRGGMVLI